MKYCHPKTFAKSVIPDEHRSHDRCAQKLNNYDAFQDETSESDNAANLRCGNCILHCASLHQGDFLSCCHCNRSSYCDNAHAADLN